MEIPYLQRNVPPFLVSDWFTPSAFLYLILYNLSTFQLDHFSPENGDCMFLRNVGTCPLK
jgi:hypothetical protein